MLTRGDVLIAVLGTQAHTMMVSAPSADLAETLIVHTPGPGEPVRIEPLASMLDDPHWGAEGTSYHAYQWKNAFYGPGSVAATAAGFADGWAQPQIPTPYGDQPGAGTGLVNASRTRGVREWYKVHGEVGALGAPPFGYDALYRIFKWVSRSQGVVQPFSAQRGTTCCAFVAACYQAATVWENLVFESSDKAAQYLNLLTNHRAPRVEPRFRDLLGEIDDSVKGAYEDRATLDRANRGANLATLGALYGEDLAAASIKKLWTMVYRLLHPGVDPPKLSQILTRALAVDVKYLYSMTLQKRLQLDTDDWLTIAVEH